MAQVLILALGLALACVISAVAQKSGLTTGKPATTPGTTDATYSTPGTSRMSATPDGTLPLAAGTQDLSNQPSSLPNYNNSGGTPGGQR